MENLIYPDGLVVDHNGPTVSVAFGGGDLGNLMISPRIEYNMSNHHLEVNAELITIDTAINIPWSHSIVFMGPPIESASVLRWNGTASSFFTVTPRIILKGGPGITTEIPYHQVADMFTGKMECLEVNFDLITNTPSSYPVRGDLLIDCKMPDWVFPH